MFVAYLFPGRADWRGSFPTVNGKDLLQRDGTLKGLSACVGRYFRDPIRAVGRRMAQRKASYSETELSAFLKS